MFGHDNQDKNDDQAQDGAIVAPVPDAALDDSAADNTAPMITDDQPDDSVQPAVPHHQDSINDTPAVDDDSDDLLDIKRQALQQLQPLVDHLQQTPEEKFKTTMMMIQASDDKSLVQTAYDAAKQISDEKSRAQALLDVINEINYFTHPQDQ
jgi:hypothetical protein